MVTTREFVNYNSLNSDRTIFAILFMKNLSNNATKYKNIVDKFFVLIDR